MSAAAESIPVGLRLDDHWDRRLASLPHDLREPAEALPFKLGLARHREQGWEAFWTFDPNRRPAWYAISRGDELESSDRAIAFDHAHHDAVFFGLLFDRLADHQVDSNPELLALRRVLLTSWTDSLVGACGDRAAARATVATAVSSLRLGTRIEMESLRSRRLHPIRYAAQTCAKLRWCSASPRLLVEQSRGAAAARAYERTFDLFGMAIQCMDDAVDADEDRALHGTSIPTLLGVEDGSLVEAGAVLARHASRQARAGEFGALARWLERLERFLRGARPDGDRELHRREGKGLGESIADAL